MSKRELEFKLAMDRQEAAAHLENLARSLKQGKVVVEKGRHFVSISPGDRIVMAFECSQKKDKEKIAIALSWSPAPEPADPKETLTISSREPAAAASDEDPEDADADRDRKKGEAS